MMIVVQRQRNVDTRDARTKLPGVEGAMHTTSYFTGGKRTRWREQWKRQKKSSERKSLRTNTMIHMHRSGGLVWSVFNLQSHQLFDWSTGEPRYIKLLKDKILRPKPSIVSICKLWLQLTRGLFIILVVEKTLLFIAEDEQVDRQHVSSENFRGCIVPNHVLSLLMLIEIIGMLSIMVL